MQEQLGPGIYRLVDDVGDIHAIVNEEGGRALDLVHQLSSEDPDIIHDALKALGEISVQALDAVSEQAAMGAEKSLKRFSKAKPVSVNDDIFQAAFAGTVEDLA